MRNRPECLPCCLRRVQFAADLLSDDEWRHRKILADAMHELARADTEVRRLRPVWKLAALTLNRALSYDICVFPPRLY